MPFAPPPPVIVEWSLPDARVISPAALETATLWAVPPHSPVPALPPEPGGKPAIVVLPNTDGLVDLIAATRQPPPVEAVPNPFRVRWHPPVPTRESVLTLGAVLVSGRPADASVCINGQAYLAGDTVAGLTLAAVGADTIELRQGGLKVLLPVRPQTFRIRQPQS